MIPAKYLSDIMGVNYSPGVTANTKSAALGIKWLRQDVKWAQVETSQGVYDWSAFDAVLAIAKTNGWRLIGIIDYSNTIYGVANQMNPPLTTPQLAAWKEFCRLAAVRYASENVWWEVWNEPDGANFWLPTPDMTQAVTVFEQAVAGLRLGNPACKILSGGLSLPRYNWLDYYESTGHLAKYDGIGMHFYPDSTRHLPEFRLRDMIQIHAYAKRTNGGICYNTEWGWSSYSTIAGSDGTSVAGRERQAKLVVRNALVSWIGGVGCNIVFNAQDSGTNPTNDQHHFGLIDAAGANKPAYNALLVLMQHFAGAEYQRHEFSGTPENGSCVITAKTAAGVFKRVAWAWGESFLDLRIPDAYSATVVDKYGATYSTSTQIGTSKQYIVTEAVGPLLISHA